MTVDITASGHIDFDPYNDGEFAASWSTINELALDYWSGQRRSSKERERDPSAAWYCINELTSTGSARVVDVLAALVDHAADDQELAFVGAGPLEDLLSHSGRGVRFVDEVERRARVDARFRGALGSVWLGTDVPLDVRQRLAKFGASDISRPTTS